MARTKIIATLGPASSTETILRKMIINGLDEVRLNFSHGTAEDHLKKIRIVRSLNKKMRRAIKIMQDLEGYRIRVGRLKAPVELKKHSFLYLTQNDMIGNEKEISFDYTGSLGRIKTGMLIYIDDGRIVLEVKGREKRRLKIRVAIGGTLKENKGINIPQADLEFEAMTKKDKSDAKIAISEKLDFVAQSFVRDAKDIRSLKNLIKPHHPFCKIIAKIENPMALPNIDDIINEADGIMVARGDLGICIPIYKVPVVQKEIIKKCRISNTPVIVATQMLESMTEERLPTRAEVSDVANAILDGATQLLLSGETAVGKHPHLVVSMMNNIINSTESYEDKLKSLFD